MGTGAHHCLVQGPRPRLGFGEGSCVGLASLLFWSPSWGRPTTDSQVDPGLEGTWLPHGDRVGWGVQSTWDPSSLGPLQQAGAPRVGGNHSSFQGAAIPH